MSLQGQRSYGTSPLSTATPRRDRRDQQAALAVDQLRDAARAVHGHRAGRGGSRASRGRRRPRRARRRATPRSGHRARRAPRRERRRARTPGPWSCSSDPARSGSSAGPCVRFTPIPRTTAPSRASARIPQTFWRRSITSFGHLIWTERPVRCSSASATATPATSASCGSARSAGGFSSTESRSADPGRRLPRPAEPPAAGGLEVRDRVRALGHRRVDQRLRRLARLDVGAELEPDAFGVTTSPPTKAESSALAFVLGFVFHSASTRTADTLYSGVPISGSPTSWRSQFTFACAKWSAIQTRPG